MGAIILLSLCACATGPQSNVVAATINPADRHVWLPADEEELENRHIHLAELDRIAVDIENLFRKGQFDKSAL